MGIKTDRRRAQSISGISMRQKIKGLDRKRLARREAYELGDQSGLSRQQFHLQQLKWAEIKEVVEVGIGNS